MTFEELSLPGTFVVRPERHDDERGFFARTWCRREFEAHGLNPQLAQSSLSFNRKRGTLRGMHYQVPPHEEAKLIRCTMGRIYDVVIDLRPASAAYKRHVGVELTAQNRTMLYVPEGCAHGFITLEDDTEVFYQISAFYVPEAARGVRWNDPAFGIDWPIPVAIIKDRDQDYPDFTG